MKKVKRDEILGLGAYEEIRGPFRSAVIEQKKNRRLHPTDELSMVFENHDSVLLQIQEMLRTERITREPAIQHEIDTYNELIPDPSELSATLFVEIADRDTRDRRLLELAGLEDCFALEIDGQIIPARNETRGVMPDRTTAVHYLKFPVGADAAARIRARLDSPDAVAFLVRHPKLGARAPFPAPLVRSILEDLEEA
jgi:hypothetical protein